MNDLKCQHLIVEVHFDNQDFGEDIKQNPASIVEILINGYNLLEPEHSKSFPLCEIDILFPKLFNSPSCLLTDKDILNVFYNQETNIEEVNALLNERQCDQTMQPLKKIAPIQSFIKNAVSLGQEINFNKDFSFFEKPKHTQIAQLFKYKETCLGGTFDHMHLGHKLLLTQACLLTSKILHVGVTGDALLQKKKYAQFIESFVVRQDRVQTFCKQLAPHLKVHTFQLEDPIGLAGTLPDLEACILTKEVEKGGDMINNARATGNLKALDLVFVDMILAETNSDKPDYSNKLSSTHIRAYLASQSQN